MRNLIRLALVLTLVAAMLPVSRGSAQPQSQATECASLAIPGALVLSGAAESGTYCIIVPPVADLTQLRGLVIFAHGYVFAYPEDKPVDIPYSQLALVDPETGIVRSLPEIVNSMGFVFATTSYSKNGLAVQEGVASVVDLVRIVKEGLQAFYQLPALPPFPIFLIGASEGGLVTTLAVERYPELFTAGTAACGPVGDFQKQVNYWGDFRSVLDVYFPPPVPPLSTDPVSIPPEAMADWTSPNSLIKLSLLQKIQVDLASGGVGVSRLLTATGAPIDLSNQVDSLAQTVTGLMDYNILATMEAIQVLGGNPYGNRGKVYVAFPWDPNLNKQVFRVKADRKAQFEIEKKYQTSGDLKRPLVLLHTTGDPIVPFWHMALYQKKALERGAAANLVPLPVLRYGHCAFTPDEAVFAFQVMLYKSGLAGLQAQEIEAALPDEGLREGLRQMWSQYRNEVGKDFSQ